MVKKISMILTAARAETTSTFRFIWSEAGERKPYIAPSEHAVSCLNRDQTERSERLRRLSPRKRSGTFHQMPSTPKAKGEVALPVEI